MLFASALALMHLPLDKLPAPNAPYTESNQGAWAQVEQHEA